MLVLQKYSKCMAKSLVGESGDRESMTQWASDTVMKLLLEGIHWWIMKFCFLKTPWAQRESCHHGSPQVVTPIHKKPTSVGTTGQQAAEV